MPLSAAKQTVVVIDALAARFGGTAYAVVQLARELSGHRELERCVVIAHAGSVVARGLTPTSDMELIQLAAPRRGELLWRAGWEAIRLPSLVSRLGADVLFSCSGMLPRIPGCAVVSLLANPVPFERGPTVGNLIRRAAIRRTNRFARAVYVPSAHGARLVGGGRNVKVVPLGVDKAVFRPAAGTGNEILSVGDFYRHKRHDLMIAAWKRIRRPRPPLRLIGNPAVDPAVFDRVVAETAGEPDIHVQGKVRLRELVDAYQRARVLLVASEHESFSMPVAEALACGVPCVVRDTAVLRETGGPGGLYVSGDSAADWALALSSVITDDDLHRSLRSAALRHAERFSWASMAEQLLTDARRAS